MAKGDKKKKKKEVIELTPAERFVQLKTLKRATRCLLVDEDVYRIYVRLTKDFAQMDELGKETPLEEDDNKKKGIAKWVVLVVIVAMIVCYNVPATRYQLAGLSVKVGFDKWASSTYEKLGDYKDCKNQIVLLEKKAIEKVKIGGVVKFGTCDWMVLERTDGKALLTKYMADNKHPYHDKSEKVTWESCALRKYLNGEFLEDGKFTLEELAMILTTNVENVANETESKGKDNAAAYTGQRCLGNDVCFCTGGYYYLWFPGGRKWCLHTSDDVGKFEVRMPMFCHDCMIKCNCSVKDSYIFLGRKRKI